MLTQEQLISAIPYAFDSADLSSLGAKIQGKVRDMVTLDGARRLLISTDRISAFDRVLGLIPHRGQVLNQLSAWWFQQTEDIVPNHMLDVPDPNAMLVREAEALPVEVVVRGYITGVTSTSLWTLYAAGERAPYGIALPDGLQKNDPLPEPIITPTTKATEGHDERITSAEVVSRGLVQAPTWERIQAHALALFRRGQEITRKAGLVLVDTKYEFGLIDGTIAVIDEIHTPDSSRYWTRTSYEAGTPENISKEFLREWFKGQGYVGEGQPPAMPPEFVAQVAGRYIDAYERLTGTTFEPGAKPIQERLIRNLTPYMS